MADTGSTDGSREVAARYADILFDFPWINDFAAARNAVLDRCSGVWYLTIDSDEWLDGDVSELAEVVSTPALQEKYKVGSVVVRNYMDADLGKNYSEFWALRMCLMSEGIRYEGAIHECFDRRYKNLLTLQQTVLHHDGYVELTPEHQAVKRRRNMELLREELKKCPEDLRTLTLCIDSCEREDREGYLQTALELIREKKSMWEIYGPSIFRRAVWYAESENRGDVMEALYEEARSRFPDSLFTRLDNVYGMFISSAKNGAYSRAAAFGEAYLENLADYRRNGDPGGDHLRTSLFTDSPLMEHQARVHLAGTYSRLENWPAARDMLLTVDLGPLNMENVERFYRIAEELQGKEGLDLAPVWARFGEGLSALAAEDSDLGRGAAMLESEDPAELSRLLELVEDWNKLPGFALAHALAHGAAFPPPGRAVNSEDLASLAARLPKEQRLELACAPARPGTAQEVCWTNILALAAVNDYDWKEEDPERSSRLARAFAEAERVYLPLCYAPAALNPENLFLLPPIHRFGFFCGHAFEAADQGDELGFVRALRQGLESCEQAKPMVEFLLNHRPRIRPAATPEQLALAEQVRTILSRFAPDDPAVAELKNSPVYQRVAYLLEGR